MDARMGRIFGAIFVAALVLVVSLSAGAMVGGSEPRNARPPGPIPSAGASFSFGAVGDLGVPGNADMVALSKRLVSMNADFLIALGDLGYVNDEAGWCSSIKSGINDVLLIAGNHDTGESSGGDIAEFVQYCPYTLDAPLTGGPGTPGYGYEYFFDYPATDPLARFILHTAGTRGSTNYDFSPGSSHWNFVVDAVNDAKAKGLWVIVGQHKLCINAGSYGCEIGQAFFDKMVELKVDLMLQAHYHTYQRSKQLALSAACPSVVSNGGFDGDCIVDDGADDSYAQGTGTIVVTNGVGGRSIYDIDFGDPEMGYIVHAMGNSGNTKGLTKGHGTAVFAVSSTGIEEKTDFCPPGTTDASGHCPNEAGSVFHDHFAIGSSSPPPPSGALTSLVLASSPNPSEIGQSVLVSGRLTNQSSGEGIPGQTILLEWSWDNVTWTQESQIGQFTTDQDGGYVGTMAFGAPGQTNHTEYLRTTFGTIGPFLASTSGVRAQSVQSGSPPPVSPPTAGFTYTPPSPRVGEMVSVDASSSTSDPGTTLQARWDWEGDGAWDTLFSSALTAEHSFGAAATYSLTLEIQDSNGLSDTMIHSVSVSERDTVAPVSTHNVSGTQGTNGWYTSGVSALLSATDDSSGVAAIHFRTDGGAWQIYANPVTVQEDGSHPIDYYATDLAGNNEEMQTFTVRIDTVGANSWASLKGSIAPDGSYVETVEVTLAATDAMSGVHSIAYRIDGGGWRTYTGAFLLGGSGSHSVDYRATDLAGNLETVRTSEVRITSSSDLAPTSNAVFLGTPGLNEWYVSPVQVTLAATSPSGAPTSIVYSLDGVTWIEFAGPFTVGEGRHTLQWQASDADGNFEPGRSWPVSVDLTSPAVEGLSPSGLVRDSEVIVSWAGSDAVSGIARYEVSIDGGPFEPFGLATSLTRSWPEGVHRVQVKSIDNAGHESVSETSFTVDSSSVVTPGLYQLIPIGFSGIALGLLLLSYLIHRRGRRKEL